MINLDNPAVYRKHDPAGMLERIHEFPDQCREAWKLAGEFELPPDYAGIDKIIVLGMGGSAIGADLVSSLVSSESRVPVLVSRDYNLPAFVDERTLVIASSYSGMTEETLSAFDQALKTGAKKLVVTTGGKLHEIARAHNIPVFLFTYRAQPRAALPYSFFPILCFLQKLAVIGDKAREVEDAVQALSELAKHLDERSPLAGNPAKQLAKTVHGRLPVVYGAGLAAEVARRWKTQINENSKAWAFFEVFPELNHNAVVGYEFPADMARQVIVLMLYSRLAPRRIQLRYRVTRELLERAGVSYQTIESEGATPLAQMMSLVLWGDYLSFYLALLYETDPSPVKTIDYLKKELGKG